MRSNNPPNLINRIYSVWFRHMRVYIKNLISNGFPAFFEPLIFLGGVGLGLGRYIEVMDGLPYPAFLGSGLLVVTAMYTSAFECSFGTFIRLEFEKVYDGMLAAPVDVKSLVIGEILWAGTKGFFFSFAVLMVMLLFGVLPPGLSLATPIIGFFTGVMFGAVSMLFTSLIKDINHLNFYMTGFLSPMFFFSGAVFPLSNLPSILRWSAECFPLTHSVRLARAFCYGHHGPDVLISAFYIFAVITITSVLAVHRFRKRLVL